eukprot:NODE_2417_length_1587_cov_137.579918_g2079_i0.p1 GENE.NODE_2417_length_1587_cov_137.579918_g2079_i0~~NODE_2417_length_1587_cov_137.579918_g2079_i0.p1  ORF type:complete len:498 (+),score=134.72 NODE_2417_length_1587_cov_137.579918_g2079_i0:57-1496(+)
MRRQIIPTLSTRGVRKASSITFSNGKLNVPNDPIIPFVEGDGCGPDIWKSAQNVIDSAVEKAYGGERKINWLEVYAGEKSVNRTGEWLPESTIAAFKEYFVGIKGPLESPAHQPNFRSLQSIIRQKLDLYCCIRPIHYTEGLPSPMRHPEHVHCTIFREATEDVYSGIEFPAGSPESESLYQFLVQKKLSSKVRFPTTSGFGIKPISKEGTERIVRSAIKYALDKNASLGMRRIKNVVLVHKGNIMKFTEGGFKDWGYNVAKSEFRNQIVTERESWILGNKESGLDDPVENAKNLEPGFDMMTDAQQKAIVKEVTEVVASIWESHGNGKWKELMLVRDTIADITLQQIMTRTTEFDVIVTMALNGAYISDALAAQVGGVGIAPGANVNYETGHALFEANHGTAPKYAGLDKVNPGGLISSGEMMLKYIGWKEASDLVRKGLKATIKNRTVTYDFKRLLAKDIGKEVSCSEFGKLVVQNM